MLDRRNAWLLSQFDPNSKSKSHSDLYEKAYTSASRSTANGFETSLPQYSTPCKPKDSNLISSYDVNTSYDFDLNELGACDRSY